MPHEMGQSTSTTVHELEILAGDPEAWFPPSTEYALFGRSQPLQVMDRVLPIKREFIVTSAAREESPIW